MAGNIGPAFQPYPIVYCYLSTAVLLFRHFWLTSFLFKLQLTIDQRKTISYPYNRNLLDEKICVFFLCTRTTRGLDLHF